MLHATALIESGPQLLAREDIDVSLEMRRILSSEGIQVLVEAELLRVSGRSGDKLSVVVLANSALAHPTMAEGLSSLFSNVPPAERHAMSKVA